MQQCPCLKRCCGSVKYSGWFVVWKKSPVHTRDMPGIGFFYLPAAILSAAPAPRHPLNCRPGPSLFGALLCSH